MESTNKKLYRARGVTKTISDNGHEINLHRYLLLGDDGRYVITMANGDDAGLASTELERGRYREEEDETVLMPDDGLHPIRTFIAILEDVLIDPDGSLFDRCRP